MQSVSADERLALFASLATLRGHLSGITGITFGESVSPENLEQGFTHAFVIDFADAKARDAYLVDGEHKKAGKKLMAALEGGPAGIVVCDIEI
jgi:Stress responsive A/B Barrel Domain